MPLAPGGVWVIDDGAAVVWYASTGVQLSGDVAYAVDALLLMIACGYAGVLVGCGL